MAEALITPVVKGDETPDLEIRYENDCLEFRLNGKLLFAGDWTGNFKEVFKRALEIWDTEEEELKEKS